jgi:hypothetical protein
LDETEARKKRKEQESRWAVEGVIATGKKARKKRERKKFISFSLNMPVRLHKQLEKRAKKVGCSMSSLVKTFIYNGLSGVVVTDRQVGRDRDVQIKSNVRVKTSGPVGYEAPAYFQELKAVIEKRNKKK